MGDCGIAGPLPLPGFADTGLHRATSTAPGTGIEHPPTAPACFRAIGSSISEQLGAGRSWSRAAAECGRASRHDRARRRRCWSSRSSALDLAEEAGLLSSDGVSVSFRHPLVRSAAYESAPVGRRQRTHAALADALEAEGQRDRAVWHRAMTTVRANEAIACALEASARRSQERGGHASAASAFERAAELSEAEGSRGVRLALAAEAAGMAGQVDRARGLIERSLPLADQSSARTVAVPERGHRRDDGWLKHGVAALENGGGTQRGRVTDAPESCLRRAR